MANLPKKPKSPKASASVGVWERYNQRLTDWEKRIKEIQNAKNKKATLMKSTKTKAAKIQGLIGRGTK